MLVLEKLDVYKKSIKISVELTKIASEFPYKYSRIRDQLIGAVISVPLNIAEGNGRSGTKERIQFFKIAQASGFELIAILDICHELNLLEKERFVEKLEEIEKMLYGLIKKTTS